VAPPDDEWRRELIARTWPTKNLPEVLGGGTATLRSLIREYLFVSLFRACAESLASQNASRLAAKEHADQNIDELLETLEGPSIACARRASARSCSTSPPASRRCPRREATRSVDGNDEGQWTRSHRARSLALVAHRLLERRS
jgi:hypothetical protein